MLPHEHQASGLRRVAGARAVKVIAVTSGKGGVGKTHVSLNLAIAIAQRGRSTLLVDADLGLANVDVLLGLNPSASLEHVIDGRLGLEEVVIAGPAGLRIVPAATGVSQLARLSAREQGGLIGAFSSLPIDVEVLVVDTATGIDQSVLGFCNAAHEVVVVVCDEPASMTDAYGMIKAMAREHGVRRFEVLCNQVTSAAHGRELYCKLLAVCDRFLDVSLGHFGSVPYDDALRRAARLQKAVIEGFPSSPAGRAFKDLAARADKWVIPESAEGRPLFFLERMLVGARAAPAEAVG